MSNINALQEHIERLKSVVENRNLALRLLKNRDFRKLIMEEFCVNEAARYVQTSADPAMKAEERADALALAQASGHLKRWLQVVCRMGDQAEREIQDSEDALTEMRLEEDAPENQEA